MGDPYDIEKGDITYGAIHVRGALNVAQTSCSPRPRTRSLLVKRL